MGDVVFNAVLFPTEPARETLRLAKLAEELGYDGVWVGDSHIIWRELYTLMGAIASQTKRVWIGSGVTHPEVRHLTVTACGFATLCEMAPGRVRMGIGIGASGPANVGLKPVSTGELERALLSLRKLFKGEAVQLDGKEMRLMFASKYEVPIYVAAAAASSTQMAARIADGIIGGGRKDLLAGWVDQVRAGLTQSGRDAKSFKIVSWTVCSVSKDGKAAIEAVKPHVARSGHTTFSRMIRQGKALDQEDRKAVERLDKEYDFRHHMGPEHSHLVPDKWVDLFAVAGTPDQVWAKIDRIKKSGVDVIAIVPYGDKEAIIRQVAGKMIG